jgi:hypothetical protein
LLLLFDASDLCLEFWLLKLFCKVLERSVSGSYREYYYGHLFCNYMCTWMCKTRGSAHWACIAHLTIEWYWSKFQREIIITLKTSNHKRERDSQMGAGEKLTLIWELTTTFVTFWNICVALKRAVFCKRCYCCLMPVIFAWNSDCWSFLNRLKLIDLPNRYNNK